MKYMIVELDGVHQVKHFTVPNFNKFRSLGYNIHEINLSLHQAKLKVLSKVN